MKSLIAFLSHRRVSVIVAIAMIACAVWDLLDISTKALLGFDIGSEHGVVLAGVLHLAKALADAEEGVEKLAGPAGPAGPAGGEAQS